MLSGDRCRDKSRQRDYHRSMEYDEYRLLEELSSFFSGDPDRIQHAVKVYAFADMIATGEKLPSDIRKTTVLAAIVHDAGIRIAEEKYGSSEGTLQEKEGPAAARKMLESIGTDRERIERIAFLVGHHHTYSGVDGIDWRILLEADFIVNAFENSLDANALETGMRRVFRTEAGKRIFRTMFNLTEEPC